MADKTRYRPTDGLLYVAIILTLFSRLICLDKVLDIPPNATQQQVRDAYKKSVAHATSSVQG